MPSRLFRLYNRASLSVKVSVPFILMFCAFWVLGSSALGNVFSLNLEEQKQAQADDAAALVKRDLEKELDNLRRTARLLATKQSIIEAVSQADTTKLRQEFLPLSSILGTDFIEVIDEEQQTLLMTRKYEFNDANISNQKMLELLITGADTSSVLQAQNPSMALLAGTAPVKNDQGIIGGVFLGIAIDNDFLSHLGDSIDGEIVVLIDQTIVTSTFPAESEISQEQLLASINNTGTNGQIVDHSFFTKRIQFEGEGGVPVQVILLASKQSLIEAKEALWLFISVVTVLGIGLITVIGYYLANAVSEPIRTLSEVSRQVIEENNFDIQSPIDRADEIGTLSNDLNQLIRWVKSNTHELEMSAHTLEARVEERTQELSVALDELQDMQSQLIQTEKMSSLGQMVAGIAHEINNPISFIQGNLKPLSSYIKDITELLADYQTQYPNPPEAIIEKQEDLEIEFVVKDLDKLCDSIKMGTQRVRDIVVSLRNYSRLDESAIKDVNIGEGLDSTLLILGHRIKQEIEVVKEYAPLPLVRCSPAQLNQVFTNILTNAIDAMEEANSKPKQLILTTRMCEPDHVQISLKDTGPGMPPEVQAKIFDPFFTTKDVGKGTGLGLGICFKIIEQHQGTIEVISEVGKGTEFVITLSVKRGE